MEPAILVSVMGLLTVVAIYFLIGRKLGRSNEPAKPAVEPKEAS